jgi:hypothetical protein
VRFVIYGTFVRDNQMNTQINTNHDHTVMILSHEVQDFLCLSCIENFTHLDENCKSAAREVELISCGVVEAKIRFSPLKDK